MDNGAGRAVGISTKAKRHIDEIFERPAFALDLRDSKRRLKAEFAAMQHLADIIDNLPPDVARRVLRWASDRLYPHSPPTQEP